MGNTESRLINLQTLSDIVYGSAGYIAKNVPQLDRMDEFISGQFEKLPSLVQGVEEAAVKSADAIKDYIAVKEGFINWAEILLTLNQNKISVDMFQSMEEKAMHEYASQFQASRSKGVGAWINADTPPVAFRSGDFDGLQSEFVLTVNKNNQYKIACSYQGVLDGNKFCAWYDENDFEIEKPLYWQYLTDPSAPLSDNSPAEGEMFTREQMEQAHMAGQFNAGVKEPSASEAAAHIASLSASPGSEGSRGKENIQM